jgi:hypothetical protein
MGGLMFAGFMAIGYGGPVLGLVWLQRRRFLSRIGTLLGLIAMAVIVAWAWHDISTSSSSTAALGILVIPPVLFVVAGATFVVDRAVVLGWRFTHRPPVPPAPTRSPRPDRDDWSGLP